MSEELIAGRYRLLEPLGRGAMSAVWEADDLELARRVAVAPEHRRALRLRRVRGATVHGARVPGGRIARGPPRERPATTRSRDAPDRSRRRRRARACTRTRARAP